MQYALCNNCLRVKVFDSYEVACSTDCECGATAEACDNYCPCNGCEAVAKALVEGCRDAAALGVLCDLSQWSADTGVSRQGVAS